MAAKTKALRFWLVLPLCHLCSLLLGFLSLSLCLSFMRSLTLSSASPASLLCAAESSELIAALSLSLSAALNCLLFSTYVFPSLTPSSLSPPPLSSSPFPLSLSSSPSLFTPLPSLSLGLLPFRAVTCTTMRMLNISKCCACS